MFTRPNLSVLKGTAVQTKDASPLVVFNRVADPTAKSSVPSTRTVSEIRFVLLCFRSPLFYLQNEHLGTFQLPFWTQSVHSSGTLCIYTLCVLRPRCPYIYGEMQTERVGGGGEFLTVYRAGDSRAHGKVKPAALHFLKNTIQLP